MSKAHLSGDGQLTDRIFKVLSLFSDRKIASEVSGKSADMLWAYTKGRNSPPFDVLARLALAKGVDLNWLATGKAAIRPLLDRLDLTRGQKSWGMAFRYGLRPLTAADFALIATALGGMDLGAFNAQA